MFRPRSMLRLLPLVAVCALTAALASSAPAAPPTPSVAVTQSWSGCSQTVTFTWSDFKGQVTASVGSQDDFNTASLDFAGQHGHGGSVSHTFIWTAFPFEFAPVNFIGFAVLRNHAGDVAGSFAETSQERHDCE